jgi:hypothetical protein
MKYLYEMKTELNMTYIDKITFMNHVKNFAKKHLGISSDNTPYLLEYGLSSYGKAVSYTLDDGSELMGYISIDESQELYEMINTILHETKHLEQHIKQPLFYRVSFKVQKILKKLNLWNGLAYTLAFHEIDARRYARKTMKKYNKELNALIEKAYNNELDQLLY